MNVKETITYIIENFAAQLKEPTDAFRQFFIGLAGIILFLLLAVIVGGLLSKRKKSLVKKIREEYE